MQDPVVYMDYTDGVQSEVDGVVDLMWVTESQDNDKKINKNGHKHQVTNSFIAAHLCVDIQFLSTGR